MGFSGEWLRRLGYLFNRRQIERDLKSEMEAHREMMGEPASFGNSLRLREESRDVWGWNWLDTLWQDIRFAARTLRHSPGFMIGAVLILSLGLGLNLTLFQVYNAVFLKPLQVRDATSLVRFDRMSNSGGMILPYTASQYVRFNNTTLSAVMTSVRQQVSWEDFADRSEATFVSANWFDEFGFSGGAGRFFHESIDDRPDAQPVVLVSHQFWVARLNSDPNIVGTTVRINNRPAMLAGILPPDFEGVRSPENSKLWIPIEQIDYFFSDSNYKTDWDPARAERIEEASFVDMYARLKPGVSLSAARESLRSAMEELARLHPRTFKKGEWLEPYSAVVRFETPGDRNQRLFVVSGFGFLSLLVLTIACANLGNLVLTRAIGRLRELSVRIALGASRWRVMRHLLAESALLAGIGSIAGLAISYTAMRIMTTSLELPLNAAPDWRTMLAAFSFAALAMIAVGFLPTWAVSRRDLGSVIRDGGQNASSGLGRTRLRSLLTGIQVAGSCIFLLLAALMIRSVQHALTPGFDFEKVAVLEPWTFPGHTIDPHTYWLGVRQALASNPETEAVALTATAPFGGGPTILHVLPEAPRLSVTWNRIDSEFFKVMKIALVAGRNFEPSDDPANSAIVSRRLATSVYGTLDVIGQKFPRTPWPNDKSVRTIIGVAEDADFAAYETLNGAELYSPIDPLRTVHTSMIVRARTDAKLLLAPMREASRATDDHLFAEARLLGTDFNNRARTTAFLGGAALSLAILTLMLACLGIFGVISYGACLRRKEISIRMALGADRNSLLILLMKQSSWPALIGILSGFVVALAAGKILESQRVYLGSLNAPVLIGTAAVIVFTCGIAGLLPALRSLRENVAQALRDE